MGSLDLESNCGEPAYNDGTSLELRGRGVEHLDGNGVELLDLSEEEEASGSLTGFPFFLKSHSDW